jgi:hypothetical protein
MESRPSRNSTTYPRPPRCGSYECCTALHKKRPEPGDGVSALPCNFLDDHGVKPVKVLKKAGLCHETQSDWHSGDAVHALYMASQRLMPPTLHTDIAAASASDEPLAFVDSDSDAS